MTIPQYLQLNKGGAMARLCILKNKAAYTNAPDVNLPPSRGLASWRDAREWNFGNWRHAFGELSQGFNGTDSNKTPIWYCHTGEQFRNEQFADEVQDSPIKHRGWYSNEDCSSKVRGVVGQLTHGRYIAGYHWSDNGERVYFGEVFDDLREAARAADSHAEAYAEAAREDAEKYQAARRLEEETEDALTRLRECIVLRHTQCMDYIRDEIAELIETIRTNRETLSTEYRNYV